MYGNYKINDTFATLKLPVYSYEKCCRVNTKKQILFVNLSQPGVTYYHYFLDIQTDHFKRMNQLVLILIFRKKFVTDISCI